MVKLMKKISWFRFKKLLDNNRNNFCIMINYIVYFHFIYFLLFSNWLLTNILNDKSNNKKNCMNVLSNYQNLCLNLYMQYIFLRASCFEIELLCFYYNFISATGLNILHFFNVLPRLFNISKKVAPNFFLNKYCWNKTRFS